MIQLITRNNSQGYLASHLLKTLYGDTEVSVVFDNDFTLVKDDFTYDPEASVVIILGVPYKEFNKQLATELLGDKLNPFTLVLHINSFGDEVNIDGVTSIVDKVNSPVEVLKNYLIMGQTDSFVGKMAPIPESLDLTNISELVNLGDRYHRYEVARSDDPIMFNDFFNFYGEWLYDVIKGLSVSEIKEEYKYTFEALKSRREAYMARRLRTMDIRMAGDILVGVLYAEDYPNEIAHWIIDQYSSSGYNKIVVLVGDHTRGNDMYRVRTKGIHAGDIAKYLNNGNGKENAGTVFLDKPNKHTMEVIVNMLSSFH